MPQLGNVLFDKNFRFNDGTVGEKLFIVLNNPKQNEPYIIVKTTSQKNRYQNYKYGCNSKLQMFYIPAGQDNFSKDTFVQLHYYYSYSLQNMLSKSMITRTLEIKDKIDDLTVRQLLNCLKKLKDDIPSYYYKIIFPK